ncbi:uncharacterized protein LOC131638116 [Vicia villosa]|uniref:uncharacterized protein LOC131638116 n=1 Tax=Vicia villosa TaxID=3911 RepID=UPI00273A891B|nr:uncharacterized protein LOC131638116 [Vicia villosa]
MGFGATWMKWMEALIFSRKMSVLLNGSPTKEFAIEKGLRQGDPLSPFLFVIVVEGLKSLVSKAVEIGEYVGFNIRRAYSVDILQFADGDGSWKQVWAVKPILRDFEIVLGLGINYHKSKLIGINVSDNFLDIASNFLSCRREENHFTFLGIPIGAQKGFFGADRVKEGKLFGFIIGNGFNTSFWQSRWMDNNCLMDLFSVAYNLLELKYMAVAGMGSWINDVWVRVDFGIRWFSSPTAVSVVQRLHQFLCTVQPVFSARDIVAWLPDPDNWFSVRRCYAISDKFHVPMDLEKEFSKVFKLIWNLDVPQKITSFDWKCFINRMPTRDLLLLRGISFLSSIGCVFLRIGEGIFDTYFV